MTKPGGIARRGLGSAALCLACIAVPDPARAQQAGSDTTTEAREHFLAGLRAYHDGQYREAIARFIRADEVAPSAALSFDIARAYERLHDAPSALRWYRSYLRRSGNAMDQDGVRRIIAALEKNLAEEGVQQVSVTSSPSGAAISVDRRDVGITPWTGELPPGNHHLMLRLSGYRDAERLINVAADDALDVDVSLSEGTPPAVAPAATTSAPGTLRATADPGARTRRARPLATWGWVLVGTGGATLAGALGVELWRREAEKDARSEENQASFAKKYDTMEERKTAARVLAGTGAGLFVTGFVMLVVSAAPERERKPTVAFGCQPALCEASVHGSF